MYYLQTRYYDPSIGQFISPDSPEYLDPETINGLSLYAYCNYNPVMNVDPTGTEWWSDLWERVGNWFKDNWVKIAVGAGFVLLGALITAVTAGAGVSFFAAFGSALLSSAIQVGISAGVSAVIGGTISAISGDNFWDGFGSGLADGIMWGGIFAGGAQIVGGVFRTAANLGVQTGRSGGISIGNAGFKILSPDKNTWAKAGGTLIKFGKAARIDIGAHWGLHMHLAKTGAMHLPIGMIFASFLGGFLNW